MSDAPALLSFPTRLGILLTRLAAVVARCLYRHPLHSAIIPALWSSINRASFLARRPANEPVAARRPGSGDYRQPTRNGHCHL